MKDLIAIYRACGGETNQNKPFRPVYFNKFKAWKSFFDAGFGINSNIIVVWDGPETKLSDYIKTFPILDFVNLDYQNNQRSLLECYEIYKKLDSKYIYFCEDDFLHLPNSFDVLMDGLKRFQFVSLYDHPDRSFQRDITHKNEEIFYGSYCHWRSAISTTCTFATNKDVFNKTIDDFELYCQSGYEAPEDHKCWVNLFYKGYRLFTPMPGFSTHCDVRHLSPYIDWQSVFENIKL